MSDMNKVILHECVPQRLALLPRPRSAISPSFTFQCRSASTGERQPLCKCRRPGQGAAQTLRPSKQRPGQQCAGAAAAGGPARRRDRRPRPAVISMQIRRCHGRARPRRRLLASAPAGRDQVAAAAGNPLSWSLRRDSWGGNTDTQLQPPTLARARLEHQRTGPALLKIPLTHS